MTIITTLKNFYIFKEYPFSSFEYQTTIDLTLALKKLLRKNLLKTQDIRVLELYSKGYSLRNISKIIRIHRQTASRRLKKAIKLLSEELIDA